MRQNFMKDNNNSEETASKISRSRSKNHVTINKLKQKVPCRLMKEQGWNDRFHLEQIPEYNYQNQLFNQNLKNKLRIPKNNEKIDFGVGRPRKNKQFKEGSLQKTKVNNKPNPRRMEQKYKQSIRKAFSDLKQLWMEKNIPQVHMEAMTKILSKQNNPMKILEDIKSEFSEISKQTSFIQKAMNSVETREACVTKIKQLCERVKQQTNIMTYRNEFQQMLQHLRVLTIHTVECIFQWSQYIQSIYQRPIRIQYKHTNINYFFKIKKDSVDLAQSRFNEIFGFYDKSDPFFLNITFGGKKISNISKNFIKRIKMCESILQEQPESPMIQIPKSPHVGKSLPPTNLIVPKKPAIHKILVQFSQFPDYFANMKNNNPVQKSISSVIDNTKFQQYTILKYQQSEVILAIDKNSSQRKIVILLTNVQLQLFQQFFKQIFQYLWQNDQCSQIRVGLIHNANQNGGFSVDSELQKKLKSLGFRWICVNNNNNNRITIYALKRPLNTQCLLQSQYYPVIIEHFTSFSLSNKNSKKIPSCMYLSILSILKIISEKKENELSEQITSNEQFEPYLEKLGNIQNYSYSGLRSFYIKTQEQYNKIAINLTIKPECVLPNYLSLLNISFKFKNNYFFDEKFIKFFPNKQVEIIICESIYPIYLLQTDEQNINIFIFQVENNFTTSQIQSVFNAMGQQSSFIDQFWIPVFKKTTKYVDEVGFSNHMMVSTDYKSKLQSLTRKSKPKTRVIKPPFVYGLINKQLLQILQVPFFCTLITKDDII